LAARAWLLLALGLAGCASPPPKQEPPPPSYASAPRADGTFAAIEERIAAKHGAESSGFRLLDRNSEALKCGWC